MLEAYKRPDLGDPDASDDPDAVKDEKTRQVKLLAGNGIDIVFEQEGIDTRDDGVTIPLSLAASVAQAESRSISENLKWVHRERTIRGIFKANRGAYFGFNTDDGNFTPDENAKYVKMMYELYAEGWKPTRIANELNRLGVKTVTGKAFARDSVSRVLTNEVYVGDIHIGKTKSRDIITGELDEIQVENYIKDHHEGIVNRELWEKVQERKAEFRRRHR